jgi:hypothetical protein
MNRDQTAIDEQVRFIDELIEENATVAGDVLAIGTHTWAIHGSIPVDGDVLLAEFDELVDAQAALAQIRPPGAEYTDMRRERTPWQ